MDSNMVHIAFRILGGIWKKLLSPILMFTGLIWPFILWFITGFATLGSNNTNNFAIFPPSVWFVAWFLMAYTFIQNVARKITHDPSFKLWKWVLGKGMSKAEKKALNPSLSDFYTDKPEGFPLGKQKNHWVSIPDTYFTHTLTTGGSGSGKTSATLCGKP